MTEQSTEQPLTPLMPPLTSRKRIVLEHRTGVMAGLHQILGCTDNPGTPDPLPAFVEGVQRPLDADAIDVNLTRAHRGAIYYREITAPEGLGTFDRSQR